MHDKMDNMVSAPIVRCAICGEEMGGIMDNDKPEVCYDCLRAYYDATIEFVGGLKAVNVFPNSGPKEEKKDNG